MILSACHAQSDTRLSRAGAHLFLTGGHVRLDAQATRAAGQPFNAGRANRTAAPTVGAPALHPFHAAGQSRSETHRTRASGNLFNGRGHVRCDTHTVYAASTFYAVRPFRLRHPYETRRAAPPFAVCGHAARDTQIRDAANSTPLRRWATEPATPILHAPAATYTQGDNNAIATV